MCTLVHVRVSHDWQWSLVCVCVNLRLLACTLNTSLFICGLPLWGVSLHACLYLSLHLCVCVCVCVCMLPKVKINSGSKCMCPCMFISIHEHTMQYPQQKIYVGLLCACLFQCVCGNCVLHRQNNASTSRTNGERARSISLYIYIWMGRAEVWGWVGKGRVPGRAGGGGGWGGKDVW